MKSECHTDAEGDGPVHQTADPGRSGDTLGEDIIGRPAAHATETTALAAARRRPSTARVTDGVLLDAARECVLTTGVRRTTLTDIARGAGVSRMTLYRRFPDVTSVLAALMTREFAALMHRVSLSGTELPTARERMVRLGVDAVRAMADDPLMRTVLDVDPELVLPYIVERLGGTQEFAEQVIHGLLLEGHRDGSVRCGEPRIQTRSLLLILQSYVLSLRPATADISETELLAEFAHTLDAALRPLPTEVPR